VNDATTVPNADLLRRALREIRGLKARLAEFEAVKTAPIAVVGMACRFPGADDADAFWSLLAEGRDAITEVPPDRWDVDAWYDPDPDASGKMYVRWGGFIGDIDRFSPSFFNIAPREAASMDPQQRLLLEIAWRALENAGLPPERLANREVGVFVGGGAMDYSELEVMQGPASIDAHNGTGTSLSVLPGRLSYFLGVRGPSMAVDTACSSSLAALHLAVRGLREGECEVALAGGVNLALSPDSLMTLCKARMLSPDGRCKTFDASANGYVRGEGCGVLVLKRLADATEAGDTILGLIRGSAVNHNGRSGGLTVPSGLAQQELIRRALADAGLAPADVAYVEAHGTGTALGDPIEVEALGTVHRDRAEKLLIGSVKSNVGHLEWAAGICGVIKVLLAMRHGLIPPSLHVRTLNPRIDWDALPVRVATEPTPWPAGRRIAGVSSFGFAGTNAHVLLEAAPNRAGLAPAAAVAPVDRPEHILALSARTAEALAETAARYAAMPDDTALADLCFSANTGRSHFEHRQAVVADSMAVLRTGLSTTKSATSADRPRIAMLFTGQGAQFPGMGRALYDTQPVFRRALDACDALSRRHLDQRLLDDILFPVEPAAPDQPIHETAFTQPALFAIEYALAELWTDWGIVPDVVMGHSVGEYVAACRAGVFSLEDGLRLIAVRGRLMQALPRDGAMLAVRASETDMAPRIAPYGRCVSLAAVNGPSDVVLSGAADAIATIEQSLAADGIAARRLTVSHAFHSPLMEPMLDAFASEVRATRLSPPSMALISNVTGTFAGDELTDPGYWLRHIREPVRFRDGMARLADCDVFLEAGPRPVLLGLGRQCIDDSQALWLPSLDGRKGDWRRMLESLGALYARGADIDWRRFDAPYARERIAVPPYPFERQSFPPPKPHPNLGSRGTRPLVDDAVRSPLLDQTVFSASWSTATVPFLADHRIFGEVVAPAASYVAHLLNGAAAIETAAARIEDLYFVAPLVFAPGEAWMVQTVLERNDTFRIVGFRPGAADDEVANHATGRLIFSPDALAPLDAPAPTLATLQARCAEPIDTAWLSEGIEGIEFGPRFRWIEAIWSGGPSETLARLRRPAAVDDTPGHVLHPGLLDACFQAAEATLGADGEPPLPFGIASLVTAGGGSGDGWWTHAVQVGPFIWDIRLYDAHGAVIVAIDGFEARKAPRTGFRRAAEWLYRIEWQPRPLHPVPPAAVLGDWLIVEDGGFGASQLSGRLRALGHRTTLISRTAIPDALRAQTSWRGVVAFFDRADSPGSPAAEAGDLGVCAFDLALAMSRASASGRLWFVTDGAAAVEGRDLGTEAALARTPLLGFVRALALEHPEWHPGLADLPPGAASEDFDRLADELAAATDETQIAWRGGVRHVARLVRHRDTLLERSDGPFRLKLQEYGSPERLTLAVTARRPPGPGEVEVEIHAAALNFRDVLISLGLLREHYAGHLGIERAEDIRLGFDCAGTIVAVGEGVTQFKVGDAIMSSAVGGSASHLTLPDTDVVLKPDSLDFEAAAAIPTVFLTASYGLLRLARMQAGERVLIHAASGGVGQAAVQLARMVGAEIFATASPEKWPALRAMGVRHLFHSRTLDFRDEILRETGGRGVDIVLNSLSGEALDRSFDVVAKGGRFVEIGKLGIPTEAEAHARRPDVTWFTFDIDDEINRDPRLIHDVLGEVRGWFDTGRLEPLPAICFAIEDAVAAYRYLQQTRHIGKVVLNLARSAPPVRSDGAYLITGGLGGLGLATARRLAEMGAGCLLLMGRRAPSADAQAAIEVMRSGGARVEVVQADAADETAVAAALRASPMKLRGVIHAAGVLHDAVLENLSPERFSRVLRPKADAAWVLHRLTRDQRLDFFVCFASMASAMGAAGQINYAAANAFLDGLAHHRRALNLPALCIDWGPWASVGMAADLSVGQGVEKIEVEDGLAVLADLLTAGAAAPAQIGVWRANWPAMRKFLPGGQPPAFLSALMRAPAPKAAAARSATLLARLRQVPEGERHAAAAAAVRGELIAVLELDPAHDIPPTRPWSDLGIDSLMMVELKNRLDLVTGVIVPSGRIARDATTDGVAALILELATRGQDEAAADVPAGEATGADDAELRRLIELARQIPQAFVVTEAQCNRQVLVDGRWRTDLASCNYLGLDLHPEVMAAIPPAIETWGVHPSWTRAVASPRIYQDLEAALAAFVGAPTTLVFPSISLLHMGVIPALAGSDGIIFRDFEAHHSIHEGCLRARANGAEFVEFPHGDRDALARELARQPPGRTKLIATDGVFSMGAPNPPLRDYARLAKQYNATVYVDDAHGFGVIGEHPDADLPYGYGGNGLIRHMGLDLVADRIVYVAGLSKAFSSYAAFVTCFDEEMKYRLEASGPYVFSGPTCTASLASALAGLRVNAREGDAARRRIWSLADRFVAGAKAIGFEVDNAAGFPVVGVVVGTTEQLVLACQTLWEHDILITPAMFPAVPLHRSLIRFSITAKNTDQEIDSALRALEAVRAGQRGSK
jgi:myxalamid-type polyketide synthase MxaB